jgi:hypothetical protein
VKILFVVPTGDEGDREESSVYYSEYYLTELASEKDVDRVKELFQRYGADSRRIVEELRQCRYISAFEVLTEAVEVV